jgi:hypothetical protein
MMFKVYDVQSEDVFTMGESELVDFANDLYWDDEDPNFVGMSLEDTIRAIEGCDYIVEIL